MTRVLVAPDSFKGSLDASAVAAALARGWLGVRPGDGVDELPMADGGEGTVAAFAAADPAAALRHAVVRGPDGRPTEAAWLILPDRTAVLELAAASGLPLLRRPDPLGAHTYGLGELARIALTDGAVRLVVGLGGSASTDGGTGALRALGARFLDAAGRDLPLGGAGLRSLARVDTTGLVRPPDGGVELLVDVGNPLLGTAGAAAAYGPQKGASPDEVLVLEGALRRLARVAGGDPDRPGSGAAGGTAFGLARLWGATSVPGAPAVAALVRLEERCAAADAVLTGEGRYDRTSRSGKLVATVVDAARRQHCRVALVAGAVEPGVEHGCDAACSLTDLAGSAAAALAGPARWLELAAARLAAAWPWPAPGGAGRAPR
jgi:glycerate kinase